MATGTVGGLGVVGGSGDPLGLVMARWVVERGGHVLPCYINKDMDKYPLVRGGVNAGTRDIGIIEGWWDRYPYAAVGVASRRDGWICFDCDGPQARDWFYQLAVDTCGGGPDSTGGLVYESPGRGGGAHWWFRWNPEIDALHSAKVRGSVGEVQLRGIGCWSLLPCKRGDGEYRTLNAPEGALAELPLSLYRAFMEVVGSQPAPVGGDGLGDLREVSPERAWELGPLSDNRKTVLAGLCWYLAIRSDGDAEAYWETVRAFNDEVCAPPLEWGIVERKAVYTWQRAQAAREKLAKEAEGYQKLIGKLFV